jgi:glyoxylase-like metal-dependent hydrolase (beta-lactamase superfamily II)
VKRLWDGVVRDPGVVKVTSFADGATLDVPGQPRIWHLPGHMRGRCALHLSDASVLFSGDVLITDDPLYPPERAAAARQGQPGRLAGTGAPGRAGGRPRSVAFARP